MTLTAGRSADANAVRTREAIYAEWIANPAAVKMVRATEINAFIERSRMVEADRDRLEVRAAQLEAQARWLAGEIRKRDSLLARAMATIDRLEAGR